MSLKIKSLINDLRQITNLKSNPFLNKTQKGHYDSKPNRFKKFKTINNFSPIRWIIKRLNRINNIIKSKNFK